MTDRLHDYRQHCLPESRPSALVPMGCLQSKLADPAELQVNPNSSDQYECADESPPWPDETHQDEEDFGAASLHWPCPLNENDGLTPSIAKLVVPACWSSPLLFPLHTIHCTSFPHPCTPLSHTKHMLIHMERFHAHVHPHSRTFKYPYTHAHAYTYIKTFTQTVVQTYRPTYRHSQSQRQSQRQRQRQTQTNRPAALQPPSRACANPLGVVVVWCLVCPVGFVLPCSVLVLACRSFVRLSVQSVPSLPSAPSFSSLRSLLRGFASRAAVLRSSDHVIMHGATILSAAALLRMPPLQ